MKKLPPTFFIEISYQIFIYKIIHIELESYLYREYNAYYRNIYIGAEVQIYEEKTK